MLLFRLYCRQQLRHAVDSGLLCRPLLQEELVEEVEEEFLLLLLSPLHLQPMIRLRRRWISLLRLFPNACP
jgi:hypothetical protein